MKIVVVLLAFFLFLSCSEQAGETDSVLDKAESCMELQPDSALSLLYSIVDIGGPHNSRYYRYNRLLIQAKDKNYYDITADTIIFAIKDYYLRQQDYSNAAFAAFYCGRVWQDRQEVQKSAGAYMEAAQYAELANDMHFKGLALGNLSVLYGSHFLTEESIAKGKEATALLQKTQDYKNVVNTGLTIGMSFLLEEKNDSALCYFNRSLQLADSLKHLQVQARINTSVAYRQIKDFDKAKKLLNHALSFQAEDMEKVKIYLNLAEICFGENQLDSARHYLDRSLGVQIKDSLLYGFVHEYYSRLEAKEKNYEKALQHFIKYNEYHEVIIDKNRNRALLELQRKYDFEYLQNEKDKLLIEKQRIIIVFLIGFLIVSLVAFLFYGKLRQKKRLMMETEQKIESLTGMANRRSEENKSLQDILFQYFNVLKKLALIENTISEDDKKTGKQLIRKFNQILYEQEVLDWEKLYEIMNKLQNGLYEKIRERYPALDAAEFRICCLSCENFSSEEMSLILNTAVNKIHKKKSSLRKKIGIPPYSYYTQIKNFFQKELKIQD